MKLSDDYKKTLTEVADLLIKHWDDPSEFTEDLEFIKRLKPETVETKQQASFFLDSKILPNIAKHFIETNASIKGWSELVGKVKTMRSELTEYYGLKGDKLYNQTAEDLLEHVVDSVSESTKDLWFLTVNPIKVPPS